MMLNTNSATQNPWRHHSGRILPLAIAGTFALSACSGPGAAPSEATPKDFSCDTQSAAAADASLTFFTAAGTAEYAQSLSDAFMKQYPKIKVELQTEADNNYNTVLPRLLASDNPPDLAIPNDLIGAVKDGLVTNLDACASKFEWEKEIPSSALAAGRVSEGGIGSGSLYQGGGASGPLVGVFYNRELAERVGLDQIPSTIEEFEAALKSAKDAGITPIVASNADGLTGHLFNLLLGTYMGPQDLLNVVWRTPGATLDTPEAKEATAVLEKWADAGYFNADANAINQDASYGQFAAGQGLFLVSGTWVTQSLPKSFAGKYGIFPFPAKDDSSPQVSMTNNQLAMSIASRSENKEAAALFLDFMSTPEAAAVAAAAGYPSALNAKTGVEVSLDQSIDEQIQAGYATIAADNGFDNWLNNATPEVNTKMTEQLQSLLAGRTDANSMVDALQATYVASRDK
jgi:raffinose/stachyose/melibiose transport system substrate-binding protein